MKCGCALAAALSLTIPCAAAPPLPHAVTASYDVIRNGGRIAVTHEHFEIQEDAYRIVSESSAVGLLALFERNPLRLTSSGRLTAAGLSPLHFEGRRGDADPRRARADFDWQGGRLTIAHGGRTDTVPLPPGTQDRISQMYQMMFLAPHRQQRLEFSVTNGRKLDRYRYTVYPGVEIETPLGRMTALHLVRERRPDEPGAEIWLAARHRYFPVRLVVLEEDGSSYEQIITSLEFRSPPQAEAVPTKPPLDVDTIKDKTN